MCGIAGILRFQGLTGEDMRVIHRMTDIMAHRGPDDRGIYVSRTNPPVAALGMRRLSIIDLSPGGHQPMGDPSSRYWIVFNGEIYNYRELQSLLVERGWEFRSRSDTEVLLYLFITYGTGSLSMVEGMFAFAVWDEKERKIFLARDRVGKKPFFYYSDGSKFLFASEIKAILAHPDVETVQNTEKLRDYLYLRYVPGPDTMFRNVYKLPPASFAVVSEKGMAVQRYWDVQPSLPRRQNIRKDLEGEFLDRFNSAVAKRMIADVPLGAFLSGGIDSSAIVSVMHKFAGENVKTYSVGFEPPWESELKYARIMAKSCSTDHHEVLIDHTDFKDNIEDLIKGREMPVSEPADIPIFIMSRLASEKVKVVLSGEGSDEIFGGYYKYIFDPYTKYYRALPVSLKQLCHHLPNILPFKFKKGLHYLAAADIVDNITRSFAWFASLDDDAIVNNEFKVDTFVPPIGIGERLGLLGYKGSEAMSYLDLIYWLPDNLLERADRITMANSLELRAPFLDHALIEFCFSLAIELKISYFTTKKLLRKAMGGFLPQEIIHRGKVGFSTPLAHWLRRELRDWVEDIVFSNRCRQRGLFDHKVLREMYDDHISGVKDCSKALWTVINLELWFRIFINGGSGKENHEN